MLDKIWMLKKHVRNTLGSIQQLPLHFLCATTYIWSTHTQHKSAILLFDTLDCVVTHLLQVTTSGKNTGRLPLQRFPRPFRLCQSGRGWLHETNIYIHSPTSHSDYKFFDFLFEPIISNM